MCVVSLHLGLLATLLIWREHALMRPQRVAVKGMAGDMPALRGGAHAARGLQLAARPGRVPRRTAPGMRQTFDMLWEPRLVQLQQEVQGHARQQMGRQQQSGRPAGRELDMTGAPQSSTLLAPDGTSHRTHPRSCIGCLRMLPARLCSSDAGLPVRLPSHTAVPQALCMLGLSLVHQGSGLQVPQLQLAIAEGPAEPAKQVQDSSINRSERCCAVRYGLAGVLLPAQLHAAQGQRDAQSWAEAPRVDQLT